MGINSGRQKDKVSFVLATASISYGFKSFDIAAASGVTAADLTTIGHTATVPATGIICLGVNAPKPPRGRKMVAGVAGRGSVNTFIAFDKLVAAATAGWSISKIPTGIGNIGTTPLTTIVVATLSASAGGALYSFPMRTADFTAKGATLGLTTASTAANSAVEQAKVIEGATFPKPGKAKITQVPAGKARPESFSSFYSSSVLDTLKTAGYSCSLEKLYPK
ncbi:MAG: hypothetical protein U7123_07300 [Potamolinea sp.]